LAVATLGSSFAFITKTLAHLQVKTVVLALLVVSALIAIPAGIFAYYKLSRRDLSTILEGSGWGMNTRMKLTRSQATYFTYRPDHNSKVVSD
jgi:ABC-type proline/glycine betaine transport system permease subunit